MKAEPGACPGPARRYRELQAAYPMEEAAMADEVATEVATAELSDDAQQVIELVKKMPALELSRLVKALEETFGVTAAAPMMMAMPGAGGPGAGAEEAEEQT